MKEATEILGNEELMTMAEEAIARNTPIIFLYASEQDKPRAVRVEKVGMNAKGECYLSGTDSLSLQFRSFSFHKISWAHLLLFEEPINIAVEGLSDNFERTMLGEKW